MSLFHKLTILSIFILLATCVCLPVMAHVVDGSVTDFALLHDGVDNEDSNAKDAAETDHTHSAAPTITSIEAVDTKGNVPGTTAGEGTADTLKSNVDGMDVVLVDDLAAGNDSRLLVTVGAGGVFQVKVTFNGAVYAAATATGSTAVPTLAATDLTANSFDIVAAYADTPAVAISGAGAASVTAVARVDSDGELSSTEFLVTITVAANAALDPADGADAAAKSKAAAKRPLSIWIGVQKNALYSKANLNTDGVTIHGRGNTASGNTRFSVNNYQAPDDSEPTPRETDNPTLTSITAPARVETAGSTANLDFTLTFNEAIVSLVTGDLTIGGGTFVSATPDTEKKVWTVAVDPDEDPMNTEVTVTLNDQSVSDEAGNRYMQPTAGPQTARYDTVNPTVDPIAGGPAAPVPAGPVKLSITFSEKLGEGDGAFANVDIDRTNSNVLLTSAEPMKAATQPTDGKEVWELTVTPVPANADKVEIVIKESSVADVKGNVLETDTIVTWTRPKVRPESDRPVVTIGDLDYIDSVDGGTVVITATDAVGIKDIVDPDDITVTNGAKGLVAAQDTTADPLLSHNVQVDVTPTVAMTTVTVTVAEGAVIDAAGNRSAAVSKTFKVGPIFTIPANTILVVTKTAGNTHNYVSDQPRLPVSQNPPVPAPNIETAVWGNMPDLEVLFSFDRGGNGGTINLTEAHGQAELSQTRDGGNGQHQSVRISEVMWASDLSKRGKPNDEEAGEQWIEITNNTSAQVSVFLFARTGRDSALNVDDVEDRVGNAYDGGIGNAGWNITGANSGKGQNGNSYSGVDFVSMHRKWDGAHNRGYVNGMSKGHWSASTQVYLTLATGNPNDGNLYNYKGSPGRPDSYSLAKPSTRAATTNVPSSPFIINEVANRDAGNADYEWIEIKNVTNSEQNLRNYLISVVTRVGDANPTDTVLIEMDNKDYKIPGGGVLLLLATDPRYDDDHPIAVGYNVDVNARDQVDGLGITDADDDDPIIFQGVRSKRKPPLQKIVRFQNGGLPDNDGQFILILRKPDNYEGHRSGAHGSKGVAETSRYGENPIDVDKIVDIAGHHERLDASNYRKTEPVNLNSTTLWPLENFSGHNRPHRGHGDWNHRRHNRFEQNRVRYRQHVKTSARNDADGSDGVNRAGTGVTHKNEDVGHYAFRDAIYTGLGYKRTARAPSIYNGTPGYDGNSVGNTGIVKATANTAKVTISEIMYSTGPNPDRPIYPQWIELYNSSPTDSVNLRNWKLRFEMLDENGDPMDSLMNLEFNKSRSVKSILPQQTILIVAGRASQANSDAAARTDVFNENRVFNVWRDYGGANKFGKNTRNMFFNPKAFHIAVLDKDNKVVDAVGNLDGDARTSDTNTWEFPAGITEDDRRTSIIRVYDDADGPGGAPGVARMAVNTDESNVMPIFGMGDGMKKGNNDIDAKWAWIPAVNTGKAFRVTIKHTWYGSEDDYSTPNNRPGMILPVELSFFRPTLEDGKVTIRWTTESELDNAGFNILRSETRTGEFKQVNAELIAGNGTTGERNTYKWVDTTAKPDVVYYYQIEDVSFAGERQMLATTKLKGLISAENKLTTTWSELKNLR